jgi:membrane protein implicated in regulation of membrane protease activity
MTTPTEMTPAVMAGARARAHDLVARATAYAAAAVLAGAAGAALLHLVAQILSFPAPIAVTALTLAAAALLHSLRRHLRTRARRRSGRAKPRSLPG